jgi:hypothetical protein
MKRIKIEEVDSKTEGLDSLLGEKVMLFCANYIYAGVLSGVNDKFVKLDEACIVYETGAFTNATYKDAQSLGKDPHFVQTAFIESYRKGK